MTSRKKQLKLLQNKKEEDSFVTNNSQLPGINLWNKYQI
jgi:hypothetical protein